ncbi:MAG TPA: hypothetical protein VNX68_17175, partial [Nitrosopumilaceae archaeon]|nr:hypothetical protein [Nitrosopumilaceae archaeon]
MSKLIISLTSLFLFSLFQYQAKGQDVNPDFLTDYRLHVTDFKLCEKNEGLYVLAHRYSENLGLNESFVCKFDFHRGKLHKLPIFIPSQASSFAISSSGKTIVLGDFDGVIRVVECDLNHTLKTIYSNYGLVTSMCYSNDSKYLAIVYALPDSTDIKNRIVVLETDTWKEVNSSITPNNTYLRKVVFAYDNHNAKETKDKLVLVPGKNAKIAKEKSPIYYWDFKTNTFTNVSDSLNESVCEENDLVKPSWSAYGYGVSNCSGDIEVWDFKNKCKSKTFRHERDFVDYFHSICVNDLDKIIAAAGNNTVHIWKKNNKKG